jgi:glycosyltransferase involved in cell wall biosynthesis
LRILLLSNKVPFPAKDGSSIAMRSMIEALSDNNAEVHVLSLNTKKHYRNEAEIAKHRKEGITLETFDVNTDLSLNGLIWNFINGSPYHVSRFYQSIFADRLEELLAKESFDIIQLEGLSMAVYLPIIQRQSNAGVVLRAHNIEYRIWKRHVEHESNPLKKWYLALQTRRLERFEKKSLEAVQANVFITYEDQRIYREWGGKSLSCVSPCGLNPVAYGSLSDKAVEQRFDLVSLASLDWLPNQQGLQWFLEKVWPLIQVARPQTTLGIGGRDMPKAIITQATDKVWMYPQVANARDFIAQGQVAIIPLLAGSGMRIKFLEYLAWGKATVSTAIGAEGIPIENQKQAILAEDAESFASAVIYLLDDKEARLQMQKEARSFFEHHFDNKSLGKELLKFYGTLV